MSGYPIRRERDDNGTWLVTAPDFPEVTTFGDTVEDALAHARDAIEEAIAARIHDGMNLPAPLESPPGATDFVELPAMTALKARLHTTTRELGITRAELARRLGWHREQVDRLFRIDHRSQLGQLEAAFRAIGMRLEIGVARRETV